MCWVYIISLSLTRWRAISSAVSEVSVEGSFIRIVLTRRTEEAEASMRMGKREEAMWIVGVLRGAEREERREERRGEGVQ
jgi:hypothetical protein